MDVEDAALDGYASSDFSTAMSKINSDQLRQSIAAILKESTDKKRKFRQTIELQIGLKNYDTNKDKRFSGGIFKLIDLNSSEKA